MRTGPSGGSLPSAWVIHFHFAFGAYRHADMAVRGLIDGGDGFVLLAAAAGTRRGFAALRD